MNAVHPVLRIATFSMLCFVSHTVSAYTNPTPQRSYVSIHGVDGASCGLAAPCRTWQYAMDNETQPGGEVLTIDSGGYGLLNITKDITIVVPPGVYGGMSPPAGSDGVVINGAGINVVLRGLTINAQADANNGIHILAAGSVTVENCTIVGFIATGQTNGNGIVAKTTATNVLVKNSVLRGNFTGILMQDGPTARVTDSLIQSSTHVGVFAYNASVTTTTKVQVFNSTVTDGSYGISAESDAVGGTVSMLLDHVIVSGSVGPAVGAFTIGGTSTVGIGNSAVANNSIGLEAYGPLSTLIAKNTDIVGNTTGALISGGIVGSVGNNTFLDNGTDVSGGSLTSYASAVK